MALPGNLKDREQGKFREAPDGKPAVAVVPYSSRLPTSLRFRLVFSGTTTPGAEQTFFNYTLPGPFELDIASVEVVCRGEGKYYFFKNGDLVHSGHTGAAPTLARKGFSPYQWAVPGDELLLVFTARDGSPAISVEAYIDGIWINNGG